MLWKRFFVISAGKTNEAHHSFIKRLKGIGQMEVTSTEKSDYLLIFCPVISQVGADIAEALDKIPRKKSLFTSFSTAIRILENPFRIII